MIVHVDINDAAYEVLEEYASKKDIGISEFIRRAVLEKLEDEEDLQAAEKAYAEYLKDPVTYSFDEVFRSSEA